MAARAVKGPADLSSDPRRARHPLSGPHRARELHPIRVLRALVLRVLVLRVSAPALAGWRVQASPSRPRHPPPARPRTRGRAWFLRAVAQPPGSCAWAGPGRAAPRRPLPGLRNGSSQQPKFCLVPLGASSLTVAWAVTTETSCLSLRGTNTNTRTHAT